MNDAFKILHKNLTMFNNIIKTKNSESDIQ